MTIEQKVLNLNIQIAELQTEFDLQGDNMPVRRYHEIRYKSEQITKEKEELLELYKIQFERKEKLIKLKS